MKRKSSGFRYFLDWEQIEEYRRWPIKRRLAWLYEGNRLRKSLPPEKIMTQDKFRRGEI